MSVERDVLELDCLVVGAGPAGLAAAIAFKDAAEAAGKGDLEVAVLEKGSMPGVHSLSGAVVDPIGLDALLPNWRELDPPTEATVENEALYALSERRAYRMPTPPPMHNKGNLICSLQKLVEWLAGIAEGKGIDVYPEFPGRNLIIEEGRVVGVQLVDSGVSKTGEQKSSYAPGAELRAKVTILCDGVRGNLTKQLMAEFPEILDGRNSQDYETGIKELWRLPEGRFPAGRVVHTMGWPLPGDVYGGSWLYGMADNVVSVGLVMALDYKDPTWDLHREFQRFKTHPFITKILEGGEVLRYGAKALPGGGLYSMPRLYGDGWLIAGDAAGSVNMARLKGIHLALQTGALAGAAALDAIAAENTNAARLKSYETAFESSPAYTELYKTRNFRTAFRNYKRPRAILEVGIQTMLGGRGLFYSRLNHTKQPYEETGSITDALPRPAPAYDGKITFDKLTDVYHSGTSHAEDQPSHLVVRDTSICVDRCTEEFGNPCQHFCPAAVYEFEGELKLNPSNCVHCKTCDIKDPYGIIDWVTPEGGGGPNYTEM
jgi:electron-transferring-flavoprotein dehydrogenase